MVRSCPAPSRCLPQTAQSTGIFRWGKWAGSGPVASCPPCLVSPGHTGLQATVRTQFSWTWDTQVLLGLLNSHDSLNWLISHVPLNQSSSLLTSPSPVGLFLSLSYFTFLFPSLIPLSVLPLSLLPPSFCLCLPLSLSLFLSPSLSSTSIPVFNSLPVSQQPPSRLTVSFPPPPSRLPGTAAKN